MCGEKNAGSVRSPFEFNTARLGLVARRFHDAVPPARAARVRDRREATITSKHTVNYGRTSAINTSTYYSGNYTGTNTYVLIYSILTVTLRVRFPRLPYQNYDPTGVISPLKP